MNWFSRLDKLPPEGLLVLGRGPYGVFLVHRVGWRFALPPGMRWRDGTYVNIHSWAHLPE